MSLNDKLNSVLDIKNQIKEAINTSSDKFSEYPNIITEAINSGGSGGDSGEDDAPYNAFQDIPEDLRNGFNEFKALNDGLTHLYQFGAGEVRIPFHGSYDQNTASRAIDWGDGTRDTVFPTRTIVDNTSSSGVSTDIKSASVMTHTYTTPGIHHITLESYNGELIGIYNEASYSSNTVFDALKMKATIIAIEIGSNYCNGAYDFYKCNKLSSVIIAEGVGAVIGNNMFMYNISLRTVHLEKDAYFKELKNYCFNYCRLLSFKKLDLSKIESTINDSYAPFNYTEKITIGELILSDNSKWANCICRFGFIPIIDKVKVPDSVTIINKTCYSFFYNNTLSIIKYLTFNPNIQSITCAASSSLINIYGPIGTIDMRKVLAVPTLGGNYFDYAKRILVPNDLLDAFKSATNWASYAEKMIGCDRVE